MRNPGLYLFATGWLFSFLLLHWLGLWAYRELDFSRLSRSFVVFSPPVVGALAAYVFTPSFPEQDEVDLDAHYFSVAPWAFALVGLLVVLAGLADLLVPGGEPLPLGAFLAGGFLFFVLGQVRRKTLHWAMLSVVWMAPLYAAFFGRA